MPTSRELENRPQAVFSPMRRGLGNVPHACAEATLTSEMSPITIDPLRRTRVARLAHLTERWLNAGHGREIVVRKATTDHWQPWVAVLLEDGKGILSVGGVTREDAIERALAMLQSVVPSK